MGIMNQIQVAQPISQAQMEVICINEMRSLRKKLIPGSIRKRLEHLIKKLIVEWHNADPIIPYTIHDYRHSRAVEETLYELVPIPTLKKIFKPNELFLLLSAVWLHDIGMIPNLFPSEKNQATCCDNPRETIERNQHIRDKHAQRSEEYIKEKYDDLGLKNELYEPKHLSDMVRLHRHKEYNELNKLPWKSEYDKKTRLPLLIAYLRLADALEIPLKENNVELKIYLAYGLDHISLFHWFKSKYSTRIDFDPENFTITIIIKRPSQKYGSDWHDRLAPLKLAISLTVQNEIDSIKDIFAKSGSGLYLKVKCECLEDPVLKKNEVFDLNILVNNLELFDPSLTPNSSSIMTGTLKQIGLFLESPNYSENIEYLRKYNEKVLHEVVNKERCHVLIFKNA